MALKITTLGEVLVDLTQTSVGENGILNFAANPGGAPANAAVAASRLGASSAFIGCVGSDAFGKYLSDTLKDNKVDISGIQVTDKASTTIAVVTVNEEGERSFSFLRKPGADQLLDAEKAIEKAKGTGILHFGSVSLTTLYARDNIKKIVSTIKKEGALITYDPNYRSTLWDNEEEAKKCMREVISFVDIMKISDEETYLITDKEDPKEAAGILHSKGVKLVLLTLGSKGAFYSTPNFSGIVPGHKVKVADTNGAGDTFFGALLSRIAIRGGIENITEQELKEYVDFANKAASITASRRGAIPAMPYLGEIL
ncbi:MAG: carbohydrate kinase [Sphaerochaetaceae bacterium]|nr:carbohydrate kinase [Sphaerochaetaceae bacterium]